MPNVLPPKLQPFAKAIYPALLTLVTCLVNAGFSGSFDVTELRLAAIGLATSLVTYLVPNASPADVPTGVNASTPEATP